MTDPELDTVKDLRRDIARVLDGHDQPLIGTALVIATADWLRQYNPPDVEPVQRDQIRITILLRFLKGVAEELSLGMEVEQLGPDDDLPTFGNA